jgi:hypothetical protein
MTKLYAIVQPSSPVTDDLPSLVVSPFIFAYHKYYYEQIYGYSLGHQVRFYNTLVEAKKAFPEHHISQDAIIEMEVDDDRITSFSRIYSIKGTVKRLKEDTSNPGLFEKISIYNWTTHDITNNDCTAGALAEMNKLYQSMKQTYGPLAGATL